MSTKFYILDARTATAHFPGIGRYVVNLARAMAPLLERDERLVLLRDPTRPSPWDLSELAGGRVQVVDVPCSPFSLRQQWAIPRLLCSLKADLYHSPYYLMPYRPAIPTVLTVYDFIPLLFPEHVSARARLFFRWTMALALRTATCVIAISQATRGDLQANFHTAPDRVSAIPLAPDPTFYPRPPAEIEAIRHKYALPETSALYLGSNKPHKNLVRLIESWALLTEHATHNTLVIAGAWDPRYPQARQRAEALGLGKHVRWLGPLPEADLPALYSAATAFVFPSLYEGFGLPVLEAMACGTPVACSNVPGLLEVAGDAALMFNPASVEAIAAALTHLLTNPKLRSYLRERGLRRAAQFAWQQTADQTLTIYKGLKA